MERPDFAARLGAWRCRRSTRRAGRAMRSGGLRPSVLRSVYAASFEPLEPRRVMAGEVLISEIMYHVGTQDQRDEFIELYNPGVAPINLNGWRFDSGVEFVFPNISLGAGQYLVVAADLVRFQTTYAGVANVIGSYTGRLSNSGERIELVNPGGVLVDEVSYADEGDWGVRERGPLDHGHRGWLWVAGHDGGGKSAELVNVNLSNDHGQNWTASAADGGTPGAANSTANSNIAPLVLDVAHSPAIPHSTDTVAIQARVLDELTSGVSVSLFHRVDGAAVFIQSPMFDDGLHGDGLAGDRVYGAILQPQLDGTVVEFYVRASDSTAQMRTYPAPSQPSGEQLTNLLYQVDDAVYTDDQPIYHIIMTEAERAELADIGSDPGDGIAEHDSNAQMNGTFLSVDGTGTEVRYAVGIRNRGKGSRNVQPNNYRVNFPDDRRWHEVTSLALNGRYSGLEIAGSNILRQAGVDAQDAIPVAVRVNGSDLAAGANPNYRMFGSYSYLETLDPDFAENHYPLDSAGNLYRGFDGLVYRGTNPDAYRTELHMGVGYEKQTNQETDDWQDLIDLTAAFDPIETPDELFVERITQAIDVEQWIRALALHELIGNRENSLPIGVPDDFSLYRGTTDTRFRLIAHDIDTLLGLGGTPGGETLPIFRAAGVPALARLLTHPEFAPIYFRQLKELSDTVLAPANINPLLDNWLGGYFTSDRLEQAKQFLVARRNHIFNAANPLVPLAVTVTSSLPLVNDYRLTSSETVELEGHSDAIRTRTVLVNGQEATWSAWEASWTADNVALRPGINRVLVQSLDENGVEFERTFIDINRGIGPMTNVGGTLPAGETRWTVAAGPYNATSTITVPAGATLIIDPGVTVFFNVGTGLSITGGKLLAEGTDLARIHLTRTQGAAGSWSGIQFIGTMEANKIAYADQVFGDAGLNSVRNLSANNSRVDIDHMTWSGTTARILDFVDSSFRVSNSTLPNVGAVEPVHGEGVPAGGYAIFEGNHFGRNSGFNDVMDFSDVHQPNAILQILNNIFEGGEDDILDLDGCDAYIEGNIFRNTHLTDPNNPDTSSAVSGGQFNGQSAQWTIVRNYFYNLDHAVLIKEGNFATIVNNTIVDMRVAAINFDEPLRTGIVPGLGAYLEGNIIWATPLVFENVNADGTVTQLAVNRSIVPGQAVYPGIGNSNLDPHLIKTTGISDPVRDLALQPGRGPARGTGPAGRDMGADVPAGAAIGGVPTSPTYSTSATLNVGGREILTYRYRLNGGPWSAEAAILSPISLSGLANGVQTLEVIGKNAAGVWQSESAATVATWTVNTSFVPGLRISEVLAQNTAGQSHEGTFPDMIELVNEGPAPIDLLDMSVTDNPAVPRKFVFTTSIVLAAGQRLVLYANDPDGTSGIHLGFGLDVDGEGAYVYNKSAAGGGQIDGVTFGRQLQDVSLARRPDASWALGAPTFGAANLLLPMGNPQNLRINEWLTSTAAPYNNDLIEIYNGDSLPIDLGGLYLTDNPSGWPDRHGIAPFTLVAGGGMMVFEADGDPEDGPHHVDFRLEAEQGLIGLFSADLEPIDVVLYGSQSTNVSQGRTPNGAGRWAFFDEPNFGVNNPETNTQVETVELIPFAAADWQFNQTGQFSDTNWTVPAPGETGWGTGTASFFNSASDVFALPLVKRTQLIDNRVTYYFRKSFNLPGDPAEVTALLIELGVDDGAVVYINGHEVRRHFMPSTGAITYSTLSTRGTNWETRVEGTFELDPSWLVAGQNVLAVEVHQRANSTDMGFDARLKIERLVEPEPLPAVRIVEMNYHPVDPTPAELAINPNWTADDFEFIEIVNTGPTALNLAGIQLAQAVSTTLPSANLAAGAQAVVVKNPAAFAARYGAGINVVGTYTGTLSDTSEPIALLDSAGQSIQQFVYSDSGDWPNRADGVGSTLVLTEYLANPTIGGSWGASHEYGGSPGVGDSIGFAVVINEVLTHTDDPLKDAIELYNGSGIAIDISGWYLSDSSSNLAKFRIPDGTVLLPFQYIVFDEDDFNPTPGTGNSFALNSAQGDDVWLMSANPLTGKLVGFYDDVDFPAAANGESFGRWPNGAGKLYPMQSRTLGAANSGPRIGPVVISEIMYHPSGNNDDLEYVELLNISDSPVELFEAGRGGWKFDKGIDFTFSPGTVIPAGGALVVIRFNPNDLANQAKLDILRSTYGIPNTMPLVGGYAGTLGGGELDNGGEEIRLARPDMPQPGGLVPYLLVDEVDYNDAAPWPTSPDGDGTSLTRASTMVYGQEPANWSGATPSPGVVQLTTITGTDGNDTYHVIRSGSQLHIYENIPPVGPPTYAIELAALGPSLTINALGGDDMLIVNGGGQPSLGLGQLIFNAGSGANSLVLEQGVARIDSTATAGTLNTTVQAGAQLTTGRLNQNGLTVNGNARVNLLAGGQTSVLTTLNLSPTATLDLADDDLVIQSTAAAKPALLSGVSGWLDSGFADGSWNAAGIISSNAATNPNVDTGLSLVDNALLGLGQFGGVTVDENALLLKYTYYGDIDANGQVDGEDLTVFAINFGRTTGATQVDGDIDFNGRVDGEDLTVFANNFGKGIGAPLAAGPMKYEVQSTKDEVPAIAPAGNVAPAGSVAPAGRPGLAGAETASARLLGSTQLAAGSSAATTHQVPSTKYEVQSTTYQPIAVSADDALLDLLAKSIAAQADSLADARLATSRKAGVDAIWADARW